MNSIWVQEEDHLASIAVEHVHILCCYSEESLGWCCYVTFDDVVEHDLGHPRETLDECKQDALEFVVSLLEQERDQVASALRAIQNELSMQ